MLYAFKFPELTTKEVYQKFRNNILTHNPEVPKSIVDDALNFWKKKEAEWESIRKLKEEIVAFIKVIAKEAPDLNEDEFQKKAKESIHKTYPYIPGPLIDNAYSGWQEENESPSKINEEESNTQPDIIMDDSDEIAEKPPRKTLKDLFDLKRPGVRIFLAAYLLWVMLHLTLFIFGISLYIPPKNYQIQNFPRLLESPGSKYIRQGFFPFERFEWDRGLRIQLSFNAEMYDYTELFVYTIVPVFLFLVYRLVIPSRR